MKQAIVAQYEVVKCRKNISSKFRYTICTQHAQMLFTNETTHNNKHWRYRLYNAMHHCLEDERINFVNSSSKWRVPV